jgi:hypothetical protein
VSAVELCELPLVPLDGPDAVTVAVAIGERPIVSLGHSQQMQRALEYIDVRFDPKATVSDQCVIRRDGPGADFNEVSFGEPPSLADQNRIVIGFIIADE